MTPIKYRYHCTILLSEDKGYSEEDFYVIITNGDDMKDKLYDLVLLWLTLSVFFFVAEYLTNWLQVVTLGGLILGASIEGIFVVLGIKLMKVVINKDFYKSSFRNFINKRSEFLKALVVVAAFSWEGVLTLVRALPGYSMNGDFFHTVFLLLLYPSVAIYIDLLLSNKENI